MLFLVITLKPFLKIEFKFQKHINTKKYISENLARAFKLDF